MTSISPAPNVDLQRVVRAALVKNDVAAFRELNDLSKDHQLFMTHALPIVWHHLETPNSDSVGQEPGKSDHLATIALDMLTQHTSPKDFQGLKFINNSIKHARDILRWTHHLNIHWLMRSIRPEDSSDSNSLKKLQKTLMEILPQSILFLVESENGRLLELLLSESKTGVALIGLCISAFRGRKPDTILEGAAFYSHILLTDRVDTIQPWQLAFYPTAASESSGFPNLITDFLYESMNCTSSYVVTRNMGIIAPFLIRCMSCGYHPLPSALLRGGLTRLLAGITYRLATCLRSLDHEGIDALAWVGKLLGLLFAKEGVSAVSDALEIGFVKTVLRIHEFTSPNVDMTSKFATIQSFFSQALGGVACLLIYPQVYKPAVKSHDLLQEVWMNLKMTGPCSPISEALIFFAGKLQSEIMMRTSFGFDHSTCCHSNPYKFCDNTQCPFPVNAGCSLGRCIGCGFGYYCSRHCQRVMWKSGHKEECEVLRRNPYTKNGSRALTPFHDEQYLRRTAVLRYDCYRKAQEYREKVIPENSIFHLDLTKGVLDELTYESKARARKGSGDFLKVTYPVCYSRGSVSFRFSAEDVLKHHPGR